MSKRTQLILGSLLLGFGILLLIDNVFDISFWSLCWPVGLILIGVLMLFGSRLRIFGESINVRPFGGIKRRGVWMVEAEEIWMFVGDVLLDLTQAEIAPGETTLRVIGFVGDINLIAPPEIGVSVSSGGFLTDSKIMGRKQDVFASTLNYTSEGYADAERKVHLEMLFFVNDLDIK